MRVTVPVAVVEPEVPVTAMVYVPAVVPGSLVPPPPPPVLPPPQASRPPPRSQSFATCGHQNGQSRSSPRHLLNRLSRRIEWFVDCSLLGWIYCRLGSHQAQPRLRKMSNSRQRPFAVRVQSHLEILVDFPGFESLFEAVHVDALTTESNSLQFESCSLLHCS